MGAGKKAIRVKYRRNKIENQQDTEDKQRIKVAFLKRQIK